MVSKEVQLCRSFCASAYGLRSSLTPSLDGRGLATGGADGKIRAMGLE
jgi:hypothetical protein